MTEQQLLVPKKEFECKHALYFKATDESPNDLLLIKEYEYPADGGPRVGRLRQVYNHERPYWITKEIYRNHKDKKEWEKQENLVMHKSTEINLCADIMRKLGRVPAGRMDLRQVAQSPFVYGTDVNSCVLTKHHYLTKWPNRVTDNMVAVVDTETDMIDGHEEIIMASITMKDRARLVVVKKFLEGVHDPEAEIHRQFKHYLGDPNSSIGDIITKRGIKLEVEFVDDAGLAAKRMIESAHEWSPDIMAFWNIDFDMQKMIQAMEKRGYNLANVFSDPAIPQPFRQFEYKQGPSQKVTASGKTMALAPAERWHEVICPASWYALDAMCVYLKLRIAGGKEPSYSLDAILNKKLGIRKLKFKEADHLSGPSWHKFMQMHYKIEYCIYNLFDCISVEMLDEKTTDLQSMISLMCAHSEYKRFPSQPRRTCDDLHFLALENNLVCAATSNKMIDENDQHVIDITDWIVTLPSHLVEENGLCLFEDLPNVRSQVRAHVADLDVEGTYPNVEILMNISKETTAQELCYIQDVHEIYRRAVGVNLSGGFVNAAEICQQVYGAPSFTQLLAEFDKQAHHFSSELPANELVAA
ncbi:DNA polymerase [Xanthomonas phage RTH11]|nr:DNA polymerase [Xanthomonas phage RTH11]